MHVKRKQYMTLMEIMIVLLIIGSAIGILGYNMKGSLDKGKAFRTVQAQRQVRDILLLAVANGVSIQQVTNDPAQYLQESGLIKDPKNLLKDGWGEAMRVSIPSRDPDDIEVYSQRLADYQKKTGGRAGGAETIAQSEEEINADPVIQTGVR